MAVALPPLFHLLSARASFLQARHAVLAQNVANADTPRYQPMDLVEPDFTKLLGRQDRATEPVVLQRTSTGHLGGLPNSGATPRRQPLDSYETTPSGNGVLIEEQLRHLGGAARGYQLATGLYAKYVGLMRTAIGTGA